MSHFLYKTQMPSAGSSEEIQVRKTKHEEQHEFTSITQITKERICVATLKIS